MYKSVKNKLDQVSPSFCLAKWLQVTLHLHTGQTHSCHHPRTHKIPFEELNINPSALHNTIYKKTLRKQMLEGIRPKECDYCWRIEDTSSELISDRIIKSSDPWALPHFQEVIDNPWDANIIPRYIEVIFSSSCNFKCAYCLPHISTSWMKEIEDHGPYQLSYPHNQVEHLQQAGLIPLDREKNDYIKAFWNWWPEIANQVEVFRITGGEPLLTPDTFMILESFIQKPNPNLTLAVNTNLGVPKATIRKFIELCRTLTMKKAVKKLVLYTSIDTWGPQAEYIRDGLILEAFQENVDAILTELPSIDLTFMCTFNVMSPPSFLQLILQIEKLKRSYPKNHIILDISYLRNPQFLCAKILTQNFIDSTVKAFEYMSSSEAYLDYEREKLKRLCEWLCKPEPVDWVNLNRKDFALFIQEYDSRRKKSFETIFPEMKDFLALCQNQSPA